jgi:hypothetical protein
VGLDPGDAAGALDGEVRDACDAELAARNAAT